MISTRKVEPIGSHKTMAFVEYRDARGSGLEEIIVYEYPKSRGGEMREFRTRFGLGLRETHAALGWSVVELCDVERGRREPESWDAVFAVLNRLAEGREPREVRPLELTSPHAGCPECRCRRGHKMDCSLARTP